MSEILSDVELEWDSTAGRLRVASGQIYLDGRAIGHLRRSRAPMTRYGRKLTLHLTGTAWRTGEQGGASLDPGLVYPIYRAIWERIASAAALDELRVRYTSIDRIDYAVELEVDRGVTPLDWLDLMLPRDHAWSQIVTTKKALRGVDDTGTTVYASRSKSPLKYRGQYPLLRVYQVTPGTIRVELEIPNVRSTDPARSVGRADAAAMAADLLSACTPWDIPVVDPVEALSVQGVRVLDLERASALEVLERRPFSGAPAKTLRRLTRQGVTLIKRALGATMLSGVLAAEAWAAAPGELPPELEGADLAVAPLGQRDRGYTASEIGDQVPLDIEDIEEVIALLRHYQAVYKPRHKSLGGTPVEPPACEEHEGAAMGSRLYHQTKCPKQYATCVGAPALYVERPRPAADYDHTWLPRYLQPVRHEPLSDKTLAGFTVEQRDAALVVCAPSGRVVHAVDAPRDWLSDLGRGRAVCDPGRAWRVYDRSGRCPGYRPLSTLCHHVELVRPARSLGLLLHGYCEGLSGGEIIPI